MKLGALEGFGLQKPERSHEFRKRTNQHRRMEGPQGPISLMITACRVRRAEEGQDVARHSVR